MRLAISRDAWIAGTLRLISSPIIAITINNSISVKPFCAGRIISIARQPICALPDNGPREGDVRTLPTINCKRPAHASDRVARFQTRRNGTKRRSARAPPSRPLAIAIEKSE